MAEPLKNMVGRAVVEDIATRLASVDDAFDAPSFVGRVVPQLEGLELKPRIAAIAHGIGEALDPHYPTALETVVAVAKAEPPIEGFAAWPLCTFVEIYGLEHPDLSLAAMEHLTKRASCEFAIRPYLDTHFEAAYATLVQFTQHEHEAVRRLPSEGTRPLLPWGSRIAALTADPEPGLALLERLRHDPSEVVRRSVANHLNDVAKHHPAVVIALTARWASEDPPVDDHLIAHALRTLVKRGNPSALAVLGYTTNPSLEVVTFEVSPASVTMGESIELVAELVSTASSDQRLVVDFVIHHITARGERSPKVFKWSTQRLGAGETVRLSKRRRIVHGTTRTYYSGEHHIDLQVGGARLGRTSFVVDAGDPPGVTR